MGRRKSDGEGEMKRKLVKAPPESCSRVVSERFNALFSQSIMTYLCLLRSHNKEPETEKEKK